MIRGLFITFACLSTIVGYSQHAVSADTLTAGVFHSDTSGRFQTVLKGKTRDLLFLGVWMMRQRAGMTIRPGSIGGYVGDHLLIVREGQLFVEMGSIHKMLGPGGVLVFNPYHQLTIHTDSSSYARYYLFTFASSSRSYQDQMLPGSHLVAVDWPEMLMKETDKGESRQIFSTSMVSLQNLNMHATTLNPGEISHPQHVHRNEEIILLRSGHVRMHIADRYLDAEGGDLVFLPSGVPHDLENGKDGRCEYFALQWEP